MKTPVRNDDLNAPDYHEIDDLRSLQLARLQAIVDHAYRNVELFRTRMDESGLKPADIQSLADLSRLPFMTKKDLRDTDRKSVV